MIVVKTGAIETGLEKLRCDGHRVAVVADGAETDMPLEIIVLKIVKFDSVISLRKI
jgi:hypothetical protein